MNKIFLLFIAVLLLGMTHLSAAVYKGQKIFVRKCVSCHTTGQSFVSSKTTFEWEELMENKGKELIIIHLRDKNASDSWDYFKSKKYTKKAKHLKEFLMEYAQDSGIVPACN